MARNNILVLTVNSELESAKALGWNAQTCLEKDYVEDYSDKVVIRWGNSRKQRNKNGGYSEFQNVINPCRAIRLNCDKPRALRKLSKVVNTPKMFTHGMRVPKGVEALYRPIAHTCGEGAQIKTGPFVVGRGFYATAWIKADTEYRAYFCGGKTAMVERIPYLKKGFKDPYPIKSMWSYKKAGHVPPELHEQVLSAAKAIGLEVGCADILFKNGKYYFTELNSAVTVNDSMTALAFYLENLLKKGKYHFTKLNLDITVNDLVIALGFYLKNLPVLIKEKFPKIKV